MLTTPITLLNKLCEDPSSVLWEEFYRIYRPIILRYAQKQSLDAGACEDVLPETMVSFFKHLQRDAFAYNPERGRFRNFLFTVVHRKVLDARRRARVRQEVPLDGQPEVCLAAAAEEPGRQEEEAWRNALFEDAWYRLCADPQTDPQTIAVFKAYTLEGGAAAEVAARFGVKENVVYQIKNRLVKRLRREVEILQAIGEKFTATDSTVRAERL